MSEHDGLVRSWHECYGVGDRAATLDYYAEDATWQVAWWREPHVGREAIGAVLDRQFSGRSDYRSEVLNVLSKDDVAFIEGIDTFTLDGNAVTLHWSTVLEISAEGKIARQRDYWDTQELKAQRT